MRKTVIVGAALALVCAGGAASVLVPRVMRDMTEAPRFYFPLYEPQKVAYHVATGGGWFGRDHRHLLDVLENHVEAVGEGFVDLRVVLQGDGVDILTAARHDPAIAARIDKLRAGGVRFIVCANTLIWRKIDPSLLYGTTAEDIVSAGVAELGLLQAKGYGYIKF